MVKRVSSFTKVNFTPKRHHGFSVLLFIIGTLFPPLAVAARFGIGRDFWLNLLLTICGYIPGHVHNFYIQNVRNNKNHRRTPKWAIRYGLVNVKKMERQKKRSQWAGRYNDRTSTTAYDDQPLEEGQEGGSSVDVSTEDNAPQQQANGDTLWNPDDERFYGQNGDRSSVNTGGSAGRWRYPANFEDTVLEPSRKKSSKKKKDKKDRWARTEDAYSYTNETTSKRKKSKKGRHSTMDTDTYSGRSDSTSEFPEDPEGGLYGDRPRPGAAPAAQPNGENGDDIFSHDF